MKTIFYLLSAMLLHSECSQAATFDNQAVQAASELSGRGDDLFSITDAEKILGEPAHLTESATAVINGVWTYSSAYRADAVDPSTGKTGNIYFMTEQYSTAGAAQNAYAAIKRSNEDHEGIEVLKGLGDEAYFHSDGQNFCFILVRSGDKMFRLKVNKLTGKTSLEQFRAVAENIVRALPNNDLIAK